mgnify:FL=1
MIDYNDLVMKMKASKIIVLALALAALLPSCAKDVEETPAVTKIDCSFKINISDITGNSVKLSAIPTKMSVKYCLSAVRRDIYELYSDKNEFAADNLIDMKMNAEEEGVDFKEYISQNRLFGSSPKTIGGLSPETEYVAFAYGISDDGDIVTDIYSSEFTTVEGEAPVNMGFEFELIDVGSTEATAKVTPEHNDIMYYWDILPVAEMTKYTEAQIVDVLNSDGTLADHCLYGVDTYTFTGLKPSTKYCLFAFVYDEDAGAGKFSVKEFTTDEPSADVQDAYRKWLGTWTVTSTSAELLGKPVSFDVIISENVFCESYKVVGWGISIARTLPVLAGFDAETGYLYFVNAYTASRYSDSSVSGYICHFGRFDHGDGYYLITEGGFAALIGRQNEDGAAQVVGNQFTADSAAPYTFSGMDYFLYAGGSIYNFSSASQFVYGNFPVGPYTLKRKENIISSDMTFSLEIEEKSSTSARISVAPSKDDETYFYDVLLGSDADALDDDQMLVMQLESAYASYGGIANNLHTGSDYQDYSGMTAGTEYCVVAFGYDLDHATTAVARRKFTLSGESESNALILSVTNPTDKGAIVSVTAANTDTYFWNIYEKSFVDHYTSSSDLVKAIDTYLMSQGGIAAFLNTGSKAVQISSLDPDKEYYLVAFGYNGNAATSAVYKKAFKTEAAGEVTDGWQAWLGTWEVTSSTSELSSKPLKMTVTIAPGTTGKKYYIHGWGISAPRNALVATVEGEYHPEDGTLSIMNNQVFAENANYGSFGTADVLYCARVFDPSTSKYVPMAGKFYAMSGVMGKDGRQAGMRCAIQEYQGRKYTVSTMEITLITSSGSVLYYTADEGYTYGDYPIGPFKMKKTSDSYEMTSEPAAGASAFGMRGQVRQAYAYRPLGAPELSSGVETPSEGRTPVVLPGCADTDRSVLYMKAMTPSDRGLGAAFMYWGGKLSWKFGATASRAGDDWNLTIKGIL